MAHCSPLSEIVVANVAEAENPDRVEIAAEATQTIGGDEMPEASNGEGHASSADGTDNSMGGGASDNESSWTYYFKASTITLGKIKEMVEKGYIAEGEARRSPGVEAIPEPDNNEAIVYEDFFITGLHMPPHPTLADILLHFQAQLHQLMPNAI
jgi:hypothetical protein